MFIFILVFNFVVALSVFGNTSIGPVVGDNPENYASSVFGMPLSYTDIWKVGAGIAVGGAVLIAIATGSMIAVGVYLYGSVFWTGFSSMFFIISPMFTGAMSMFFGIGFAIMIVIFIASVVGMLTGSG